MGTVRRSRARVLSLLLVAAVVVVACGVLVTAVLRFPGQDGGRSDPGAGSPSAEPRPTADPRLVAALGVLRRWDRDRAVAWTSGDVAALRSLYVPGSTAGRRDVAMLRAWAERGLRPTSMRTQVLSAQLRDRSPRRLRLLVTDRVVVDVRGPTAGAVGRVPDDEPSTRLVVLRRPAAGGRHGWRVVAVYDRAAATTDPTSGSANS